MAAELSILVRSALIKKSTWGCVGPGSLCMRILPSFRASTDLVVVALLAQFVAVPPTLCDVGGHQRVCLRCCVPTSFPSFTPFPTPAQHLYKKLGAKLSVGMPFKDIATSDSVLLRQLPAVDDKEGRR